MIVKSLGIDLDDVLADFYSAAKGAMGDVVESRMWDENFFLNLKPVPGSKAAVFELEKMGYDLWIVSQPLAGLPESYSHKAQWVHTHFPQLYKKIILTQDKGLIKLDYLIDDNEKKWKDRFESTGGKFVHLRYGGYNLDSYNKPTDAAYEWSKVVYSMKMIK